MRQMHGLDADAALLGILWVVAACVAIVAGVLVMQVTSVLVGLIVIGLLGLAFERILRRVAP